MRETEEKIKRAKEAQEKREREKEEKMVRKKAIVDINAGRNIAKLVVEMFLHFQTPVTPFY